MRPISAILSAVVGLALLAAPGTPAQAKSGVNAGILRCTIEPTVGLILGSTSRLSCVFEASGTRVKSSFSGRITKVGVSVGFTRRTQVRWLVFAPGRVDARSIQGDYVGASASATAGLGLGANALVGGFQGSIGLQPVSVQAQTGLNIALGIAGMNLQYRGK